MKSTINALLKQRYEQYPDSYVSMTTVEKLGINPGSAYNTPLGIYSYPLNYVLEKIGDDKPMSSLPFMGNAPYANVFEITSPPIVVDTMPSQEAKTLISKMVKTTVELMGVKPNTAEYNNIMTYIRENIIETIDEASVQTPGGIFWYVSMKLSLIEDLERALSNKKSTVRWNTLLRNSGIHAVLDNGASIIHRAEPTQMVLLEPYHITNLERFTHGDHRRIIHNLEGKIKNANTLHELGELLDNVCHISYMQCPDFHKALQILSQNVNKLFNFFQYYLDNVDSYTNRLSDPISVFYDIMNITSMNKSWKNKFQTYFMRWSSKNNAYQADFDEI